MKKKLFIILILILILTIIASLLGITINKYKEKARKNNLSQEELQEQEDENALIEKLATMTENDRVKIYFGEYIKYIGNMQYEKAYNCLNDNFKNNYFNTLNSFEEYIKDKYPEGAAASYKKTERYGDVFVLTVKIIKLYDETYEGFEQRFVIRENGANDFKISFQVEPDSESNETLNEGNSTNTNNTTDNTTNIVDR